MRRLISYLIIGAATLVGVGASFAPTVLRMDTDMAYSSGKTLYFRASEWDDASLNGNYTNESGTFLEYNEAYSKQPIAYIADTMRSRLDAFGLSGYRVETQGTDTLAVTVRTGADSDTLYSYLERYLSFNGGDFELDASDVSADGYAYNELWSTIIDGQTASIVDMEQGQYNVPTVVIPLKSGNDYKTAFDDLVKYCTDNSSEADEEAGTDAKTCNIVVWANRAEGDTYENSSSNPNVSAKIVSMVNPANAAYYASTDEKKENPSLRLIPSSAATGGESYDPTKTQEAYEAAKALMLTINAGEFRYSELQGGASTAPKFAVNYLYSEVADASVENLAKNGDWNRELAMSSTLIATLVCAAFMIVLLAVFERIMSVLEISVLGISTFSALATFVAYGAPFNIAALIGLVGSLAATLFGSLFYSAKLKEEIYKGRSLKKAHTEAVRKSLWPTIDMGIVTIVIGICVYGLAGDVASKAGVMLVLGGFFGLLANLLYTRVAGWLLCNDSYMASAFPKFLGVRPERIPDLAKEEKPSYFGPYAGKDFSKGKWISLAATCLLVLGGIGTAIGFGVASGGTSFFNSSAYESAPSVLRIDVRSDEASTIKINGLSEISALNDANFKEGDTPNDLFHLYKIDGKYLSDYVTDLTLSSTSKSVYQGETGDGETYYWFYYQATLGKDAAKMTSWIKNAETTLSLQKWNGSAYVAMPETTFAELAGDLIAEVGSPVSGELPNGAYSEEVYVTFSAVTPADLTPYLWQVTLALGVGIASVLVYLAIRYRPSRGLIAGLILGGSAFIGTSFFIITRISTLPMVSLGSIPVAIFVAAIALFVLSGEREIFRESKQRDKDTAEFRNQCLAEASGRQAGNVLLLALLGFYVAVVFLAFGPRIYGNAYLAWILGLAFGLALVLTCLSFFSGKLGLVLGKIRFQRDPNKIRRKKKAKTGGQLMKKGKSAEPEESIFIGIND